MDTPLALAPVFTPAFAIALALVAGAAGGAMNALAGGGTFATMPALIALGLPGPVANATSNVALQPGSFASAWAYRGGLEPLAGLSVRALAAINFAGGVVGSLLLVATTARTFDLLVPWLLLVATLAIAFGAQAARRLQAHVAPGRRTLAVTQALLGVYGGYFGGGVGLMMVAAYGILAGLPPHRTAAPRTLMLACTNTAATVVFVFTGLVHWLALIPMSIGAVVGGYLGARVGRRLSPSVVRGLTLTVTAVTTVVFFWRAYT